MEEPKILLDPLLELQQGVATLDQLEACGVSRSLARANVAAQRWQRYGDQCVVTHNFEPTRAQWMWIALLDTRAPAALAGVTALEIASFTFFGDEMDLIHIVVPRGTTYHRFPGVKIHESRRFGELDIVVSHGYPHTPFPRSALDGAAWQPYPRYACALLAAVVQQTICDAQELSAELRFVGRIRHKQPMRLAIQDIAGGAEALSEIDVAKLCRTSDLAEPDRQVFRCDADGRRRWLDNEWRLPDGSVVVLEVDGSHHMNVEHWGADKKRDRKETIRGRKVLRCTAYEARFEQREVANDLVSIGIPGVVSVSERPNALQH